MKICRLMLLCSVAPMAFAVAAPLQAQAAAANATKTEASAKQTNATDGVEEIMVVAQRRSERLRDVPLSVTALSAKMLTASNITTTMDLPMLTPGLRIESTAFFVQPAIRGISTTFASATSEANVATYIDGVYQQSTQLAVYDLPDVESIEVLKGPQGTLFGRNATGGAILINTMKPDLHDIKGSAAVSYSNYNTTELKGFVTAPIVADKLAVGLTGMYEDSDGWKRDLLRGGIHDMGYKTHLVRGKVRFIPWEGADFTLTGFYSRRNDKGSNYTNYMGNNISKLIDPSLPIASEPWTVADDIAISQLKVQKGVNLHGEIEAGPGSFSTTTAYDKTTTDRLDDPDFGALPGNFFNMTTDAENFSQEFLYTTNKLGRFHAVGGRFYYRLRGGANFNLNNYAVNIYYRDKSDAYAGFGELSFDLTDQLTLTGGLRYSSEKRQGNSVIAFGTTVQPPYMRLGDKTFNAATPRVTLLFKATDRTNLYATYSKGFTSGFFNSLNLQTTPVGPEHVDAYEIGVKSSEIKGLTFSAAGFYYDYKDMQILTVIVQNGLFNSVANNAAKSRIYGAEFNANWRVTDDFDLTVGGTYLHARYKDYPNALIQVPTQIGGVLVGGNTPVITDVSGNTMIRSPNFSGNLTAHYHVDTTVGAIDATGTAFYSTKVFYDIGNRVIQKSYALLNANLTWQPINTGITLSVWGKNLTNHAVINSVNVSDNFDAVDYLPPRQYGVTLGYKF